MDNFKRLSMQELYDVEGGIFGVDDAIKLSPLSRTF